MKREVELKERSRERLLQARRKLLRWSIAWVVFAVATMSVGAASVLPDLSAPVTFDQMAPAFCLAAAAVVAAVNAGRAWLELARAKTRAPDVR